MDKRDRVRTRTSEDVMRRLGKNVEVLVDEVDGLTVQVKKKVGEDEIISKINQSAEAITLDANKININGVVSANGNFSIDREGNMECKNANISGGSLTVNSTDVNPEIIITNIGGSESIDGRTISERAQMILSGDGIRVRDSEFDETYFNVRTYGSHFQDTTVFAQVWVGNEVNDQEITLDGQDGTISGGGLYLGNQGGNENPGFIYIMNANGTPIELDGSNGRITCVSLTQTSLEEKKKDFEKLESGLEIVKDTDIYKYHLKNEQETDKKHIGFVIGENYKYRQELTDLDNKGVDLYSMVSVLWRAVQEQQVEIEKLKKEVKNDKS